MAEKTVKPRKKSRGETLARLEEVASTSVGDDTPIDAAFARFGQFDGAQGQSDAAAIAAAQELVRQLLRPSASCDRPSLVQSERP